MPQPLPPSSQEAFLRHLSYLRRWCARKSGDPHLADDMVQETALHALRRMPFLKEPDRMRGWLFRIMQRRLADISRDQPELLPLTSEPTAPLPRVLPDPDTILHVERALNRLPARLSKPMRLHYLEGQPLRQVALSLRTSVNGVKARLYRARRILRAQRRRRRRR